MPEVVGSTEALEAAVKRHLDRVWTTKGSRFNAHRRLLGKHSASQFALAVLSIYAIAASVATLVLPQSDYPKLLPALSAATVVASVFILVQGLLESAKNYQLRAFQMQRCGEKLAEHYNLLSAKRYVHRVSEVEYLDAVHEYSTILADYPENHEDNDYWLFVSSHKHNEALAFLRWLNTSRYELKNLFHMWGSSTAYIVMPPAAVYVFARWIPL
jgi:SMODS and SLOG-associating 2TM effector domain family 5